MTLGTHLDSSGPACIQGRDSLRKSRQIERIWTNLNTWRKNCQSTAPNSRFLPRIRDVMIG